MFRISITCALLILSLISVSLQIAGIVGCDYVRIHFKALNDNGIYFKDDSYVGLGLYNHQVFTEKNTRDWTFDSTCKKYESLESDMFLEGNLSTTAALSISSIVINGILVIGLLFTGISLLRGIVLFEGEIAWAIFTIVISILSATALALQAVAVDKIHDEGGICDRDSYFPDEWNVKFPFQLYPSYAYFKYFHECKVGSDGNHAKMSIIFSTLVCAVAMISSIVMLLQIPREGSGSRGIMARKTSSKKLGISIPPEVSSGRGIMARKTSNKKVGIIGRELNSDDESYVRSGELPGSDATVSLECDEEMSLDTF